MTGTVHSRGQGRFHFRLNSDGQSHKLVNVLTIFVLTVGLVSFVLGIVIRNVGGTGGVGWAAVTTSTGLVSLLLGLYTQMISATREQRVLIVTGIIAGFVGLAIGLAHGGFGG
jgi:uncharacterized membrane protein